MDDDHHASAFFGPFACILMDEIYAAALGGDENARKVVRRMLPVDFSSSEAITWRNDEIRALSVWLIEGLAVRPSYHLVATLIATAGAQLTCRHDLPQRSPFDRLAASELAEFATRVRYILARCPRWPKLRQTLTILNS